MAVEFNEYMNKVQEETLNAAKQVQESNIAAMASFREFFSKMPMMPFAAPDFPEMKTMIENSFDFANRMIDLRKKYTIEFAEIWARAQKDAAQNTAQVVRNTPPSK